MGKSKTLIRDLLNAETDVYRLPKTKKVLTIPAEVPHYPIVSGGTLVFDKYTYVEDTLKNRVLTWLKRYGLTFINGLIGGMIGIIIGNHL